MRQFRRFPVHRGWPRHSRRGRGKAATWEDAVFIESRTDKSQVYEGDQVLLILEIGVLSIDNLDVRSYRNLQFPKLGGVLRDATRAGRCSQKARNGYNYEVTEYRVALYPTQSGDLKIGAWHWEGVGTLGIRGQHEFSLNTAPIPIKVLPLPDRPANFSGAVGSFQVQANVSRTDTVQGGTGEAGGAV